MSQVLLISFPRRLGREVPRSRTLAANPAAGQQPGREADVSRGTEPAGAEPRDPGGAELFDLPEAPRPDPATPAPVRLVAEFDNLILSHADRARIISEPHRKRLFSRNGIFPGTVLVRGFAVGIWRIERSRGTAAVTIELFEPIGKRERHAVATEGQRLLAFAVPDAQAHDVRFTPSA